MTPPDLIIIGPLLVDRLDYIGQSNCAGGSVIYASLAAKLQDIRVGIVSVLGNDYPISAKKVFNSKHFDLSGVKNINLACPRCDVVFDNGQRHFYYPPNELTIEDVQPYPELIPKHFLKAKAALITAFNLSNQLAILNYLKKQSSMLIGLDASPVIQLEERNHYWHASQQADFFMPSFREYLFLSNDQNYQHVLKQHSGKNQTAIILKRGEHGILAYDIAKDEFIEKPPQKLQTIIDVNGAGDSFCGAFMANFILHRNLNLAIDKGQEFAALCLDGVAVSALINQFKTGLVR